MPALPTARAPLLLATATVVAAAVAGLVLLPGPAPDATGPCVGYHCPGPQPIVTQP